MKKMKQRTQGLPSGSSQPGLGFSACTLPASGLQDSSFGGSPAPCKLNSSPGSTRSMPVAVSFPAVTTKNVSRHCQMSPTGQNCPWLRIVDLVDKTSRQGKKKKTNTQKPKLITTRLNGDVNDMCPNRAGKLPGMHLSLKFTGPSRFFSFYRLTLGDLIHPVASKISFSPRTWGGRSHRRPTVQRASHTRPVRDLPQPPHPQNLPTLPLYSNPYKSSSWPPAELNPGFPTNPFSTQQQNKALRASCTMPLPCQNPSAGSCCSQNQVQAPPSSSLQDP